MFCATNLSTHGNAKEIKGVEIYKFRQVSDMDAITMFKIDFFFLTVENFKENFKKLLTNIIRLIC